VLPSQRYSGASIQPDAGTDGLVELETDELTEVLVDPPTDGDDDWLLEMLVDWLELTDELTDVLGLTDEL
jgi:hypothetical protein